MCFFDQIVFSCEDWKWDRFRGHCNREYRTGETCGMKLLHNSIKINGEKCKICQKLDAKRRRREDQISKINRWQREGGKLKASIEKATETVEELNREIGQLEAERLKKRNAFGRGC